MKTYWNLTSNVSFRIGRNEGEPLKVRLVSTTIVHSIIHDLLAHYQWKFKAIVPIHFTGYVDASEAHLTLSRRRCRH